MRIMMMGTGPFAVPTFESLLDSQREVAVLVTRPLPPVRTRGKTPRNPMREVAEARNVEVVDPDDVNSETARKQLAILQPDLLVVCDFGQILSRELLSVAPLGGINLHGSLLPKYRGAAPVQWAVFHGETETGVSVIHMSPKLDAGPILSQLTTPIRADETAAELERRLAKLGVQAVHESIEILDRWDRSSSIGSPQDVSLACRAPRLRKRDGEVNWSRPARQIRNQVRAFKPWPGTYTSYRRPNGQVQRLILDRVSVVDENDPATTPGTVVASNGEQLFVATGKGTLSIDRLQPAGKRAMEIEEFLRGHPIEVGVQLGGANI